MTELGQKLKLFIASCLIGCLAQANDNFRVYETGTQLQVVTPYGNKIIEGDFPIESTSGYRVEIPLSDLAPAKKDPIPDLRRPAAVGEEWGFSPPPGNYDDTDRLLLDANHLYNQGRFYDATLVVETLLKRNPKLQRAWLMKGSLMYVQGQKDLAKKAWEQAVALAPGDESVKGILERYK